MTNYSIAITDPAPSLNQTYTHVVVDTYAEAVSAAHTMHKLTGRTVCLYSAYDDGLPQTYYWHRVTNGQFVDRNTNSGVPATGHVA